MEESEQKEDIYTVELEEIAGFRRLLGACVDPALIIYKDPKVRPLFFLRRLLLSDIL